MTVQDIAEDLFRYIGITSLNTSANTSNLNIRTLESGDLAFAAGVINASLQEIFAFAPAYIREREVSEVLRDPVAVTLDCTNGSKTIANLTTYAAWQLGCTIRISGDEEDNQIISSTELLRPYLGSTATGIGATVYSDAIKLDSTYGRVLEPVRIPRVPQLRAASSKEDFYFWKEPNRFGGGIPSHPLGGWHYDNTQKSIGLPVVYFTEARYDGSSATLPLFLRFNPMPDHQLSVTFRVKVKPTAVTVANIGDHTSDPGINIPIEWHESILLPICRKRFMAHPHFTGNPEVIAQIREDYETATRELREMSPQTAEMRAIYAR